MLEQIKASAGSGKTHALTRRFLELICRQNPWEEKNTYYCRQNWLRQPGFFSDILAVTFTNKAAAEMKARVLTALKGIALGNFPDAPEALSGKDGANLATSLIMAVLRRYDALNIRTIDSLLNLLARISAVGLHIPPNFDLIFDEEAFFSPLYEELLDMADQGEEEIMVLLEGCARHLLDHANFKKFTPKGEIQKQLLKILALLQKSEKFPCLDRQTLEKRLQAQHAQLNTVLDEFTAGLETRKISANAHFRHFMHNLELYVPNETFPNISWALKKSFADCCQSKYHPLIDAELEQVYHAFGQELLQRKFSMNAHISALTLLPYTRTAALLLPKIERLQQKFSLLSGAMLPVLAAKALNMENGVSEACCRLGSRLDYMLIDEFQDTSRLQWTAMETLVQEALARGGAVCYAGDVKQAIYSWRGGDSSLFEEVISSPAIAGAAGDIQRHNLNSNWRSTPAVIQHNNRFFSRLAEPGLSMRVARALLPTGHPEDSLQNAAALLSSTFTGAEQHPAARPGLDKTSGFVQIIKIWAENTETLRAEVKQNLRRLFTEDLLPRRRASDIAVLVRSNDEGNFVSQCLLDQGIKVMTEHSFRLEGHPLIRRFVALLRFLDYPPDNLAFMSAITNSDFFDPTSSLTAQRLLDWGMDIISERRQDDSKRGKPLFHFFIRDFPDEWGLWLEPFYKQAGLMGIYDMVFEICRRFALLERYHEHDAYLRRFLELAHMAEKKGLSSLAAFLDFWRETGKEEKIPSPENSDAVRVMTVHGAKGLEFEVVVMPFHRFTGNRKTEYEILEKDRLPLLVRQDPEINFSCHEQHNIQALEKLHLLYVGWTRAKEELYALVGGTAWDRRNPGLPRAMHILLEDFSFSESGVYSSGERPAARQKDKPAPRTPNIRQELPLTDPERHPLHWMPSLKIFRNPVPELEYDQRTRGVIFHNCLERLHIPEKIAPENLENLIRQSVRHTLRAFHLPLDHLAEAGEEIKQALLWFCRLPRTPDWLRRGYREQTLMDKQGKNFRLDLLVEENPEDWLALEYKSGSPKPEHQAQLRNYLNLLRESGRQKTRGLLVYLDMRRLEEVA